MTKLSHVCKYCDTTWLTEYKASDFIGHMVKKEEKSEIESAKYSERDAKLLHLIGRIMENSED